jgi:hypothetical protein
MPPEACWWDGFDRPGAEEQMVDRLGELVDELSRQAGEP